MAEQFKLSNPNGIPEMHRRLIICHADHDDQWPESIIQGFRADGWEIELIPISPSRAASTKEVDGRSESAPPPKPGIGPCIAELSRMLASNSLNATEDGDVVAISLPQFQAPSPAERYQARKLWLKTFTPPIVDAAYKAFLEHPEFGVALPPGTPRTPLSAASSGAFISSLATRLGIKRDRLEQSLFFPATQFFVSGACIRKICERYRQLAKSEDNLLCAALDLGFHAMVLEEGMQCCDLKGMPRRIGTDELLGHLSQISRSAKQNRHPEYRDDAPRPDLHADGALRYIAYYLPQFHAIPENDRWWGRGFTEWSNVTQAVPRFIGHMQPRLPEGTGFYDLSNPQVLRRQTELARRYGIHGFCFYFYWFNDRTLLERPLQDFLADRDNDFPFCLCWANENWTRRWDGQEQEVLIEQSHSARDDLNFIAHIAAYLKDPRYIRVAGKPLLLVYRASLLDNARETAKRWREWCRKNGVGEIYLAAVLSFEIDDPRPYGFDAAVEFPPHQLRPLPPIDGELAMLDRDFSGEILDYRETVLMAALDKYIDDRKPPFPLMRGVMTGWDNDARRKGNGRVFHHATPSAYSNWLRLASTATLRHNPQELQYVFINAWNEWAEGAHLEADQRFGHAYLAATADTLRMVSGELDTPPANAGTSSGALRHIPAGVLQNWDAQATQIALARLTTEASIVHFRLALLVEEGLSPDLLDTLNSIAEQSYRQFSLHILCSEELPLGNWFDHPGIEVVCEMSAQPALRLNELALDAPASWLLPLRPGDRLFPYSLLSAAVAISRAPASCMVLADELHHSGDFGVSTLRLLPPPALADLRACGLRGGFLAIRGSALSGTGGLHAELAGAMETDLALRLIESHGIGSVLHLADVVLWRNVRNHPDLGAPSSLRADALQRALKDHLERCALKADALPTHIEGIFNIVPQRPHAPFVSIIVCTHDQPEAIQRCVEALFANTAYPNFELIVIDHDNSDNAACLFLDGLATIDSERIRVLRAEGPFNYAKLNNLGAHHARGEYLLLLNDDVAALHPEWLDALVDEFCAPDVAIVGPRLVFPDGRVQHAGIALGMSGAADFPFQGHGLDASGPDHCLAHVREVSAVSGSCLLTRKSLFEQLGGLNEQFDIGFADIDFCLRVTAAGQHVLWTPRATLMHETGRSLRAAASKADLAPLMQQRFEACRQTLLTRWHNRLARDPHLNPHLNLMSRQLEAQSNPLLALDPVGWCALPKVLALPADKAGSGEYRVALPAREAHQSAMARTRIVEGYPLPVLLEKLGINTLHTQRQVDDQQLSTLKLLRETLPIRIVMDFDDLLSEVPPNSIHARDVWPDIERRMRAAAALSDTVTVSTAPLAEALRSYHDDVRCIPNALDARLWRAVAIAANKQERRSKRLRVGWAGGISHAADLKLMESVVRDLADEVDWVFFGMTLDTLKPYLSEFHRGVPLAEYPLRLAELDLDLALAPLELNRFNECKSNLRLLEYGALGIPVVATDIVPYQCGLPITLVKNRPTDWIRAIRARIGERAALGHEGATLQQAVLQNWTLDKTLQAWVSAWTR